MKQTQSSSGRIMKAYLLSVKLKCLWVGIHRSVSLLSVTPWLSCWRGRKGIQFLKPANGKMLVKMYCPVYWLILYVDSLIHSYAPICLSALSCPTRVKTWEVLCLWCRGEPCFLVSLSVQLCSPRHAGHYHLHLLPAEVLCVLHQPACAGPPAFAVWVRHLWVVMSVREACGGVQCQREGRGHPVDICLCASPGGPSHLSCTQPPLCSRSPALPMWSWPASTSSSGSTAVWPRLCWSSSPTMWVLQEQQLQLGGASGRTVFNHGLIAPCLWDWHHPPLGAFPDSLFLGLG